MPPYKQPNTLKNITLIYVTNLVRTTCARIDIKYLYSQWRIANATFVDQLRAYLIHNLGHHLDDIYNTATRTITRSRIREERLFLDIVIHKETRHLKKLPIGLDSVFVMRQLGKLDNVISLDISGVNCTDSIMFIIGNTCYQLEEFTFRSTTWFCTETERKMKLSLIGFLYLLDCKRLRTIYDTKGFHGIGIGLFKTLIRHLKDLECINHPEMGRVLCEGLDDIVTNIRKIKDRDMQSRYIEHISRICPRLEIIEMDPFGDETSCAEETLILLSNTSLNLTHITLMNFPLERGFDLLIKSKGKRLTYLSIHIKTISILNVNIIKYIGESCPYLKSLYLGRSGFDETELSDGNIKPNVDYPPIFQYLENLSMSGPLDFDQGLIQVCLKHALHIKEVLLFINGSIDVRSIEAIFDEVMKNNPMSELEKITWFDGRAMISKRILMKIIGSCKSLKECSFMGVLSLEAINYLRELARRIRDENLDLKLCWDGY